MFGKILYISDNIAHVQNLAKNKNISMVLISQKKTQQPEKALVTSNTFSNLFQKTPCKEHLFMIY